jgi:acyl carrier protein
VFFNYLDFHQVDGDLVDEEQILNDNDNEFALHVFSISGVIRLNTTNHRLSRAAAVRLAALYRTVLAEMSLGPDGDATAACLPPGELAQARALVSGVAVRVVDTRLRPLAAGVAGELCVGGNRTGQLARFRSDGTLERLGPIEPGTPDGGRMAGLYRTRELLDAQPSVRDSYVLARAGAPPGRQLAGYVRMIPGAALDTGEVRRALARGRLPQQLIPDVLIGVDEWPLDQHGAIDASRLPEPGAAGEVPRQPDAAQTPWDELFGTLLRTALDRVGYQGDLAPDEPLSSSGLDSFGTVGLLLAIEQAYGVIIPDDFQITEIVRTPRTLWDTVAALCPELGRSG